MSDERSFWDKLKGALSSIFGGAPAPPAPDVSATAAPPDVPPDSLEAEEPPTSLESAAPSSEPDVPGAE